MSSALPACKCGSPVGTRKSTKCNRCQRNYLRKWHKANPEKSLLIAARARAKRLGIPFSITLADVVVPAKCPALGCRIVRGIGKPTDFSPTIDRLDPTKGYVPGNIAVISHRANRIKNDATVYEMRRIAEWMVSQEKK